MTARCRFNSPTTLGKVTLGDNHGKISVFTSIQLSGSNHAAPCLSWAGGVPHDAPLRRRAEVPGRRLVRIVTRRQTCPNTSKPGEQRGSSDPRQGPIISFFGLKRLSGQWMSPGTERNKARDMHRHSIPPVSDILHHLSRVRFTDRPLPTTAHFRNRRQVDTGPDRP